MNGRDAAEFTLTFGDHLQVDRAFIACWHLAEFPGEQAVRRWADWRVRFRESHAEWNAIVDRDIMRSRVAGVANGDHKSGWTSDANFFWSSLLNQHDWILRAIEIAAARFVAD